jgi:glycine cleavage system H protein
LINKDPYASGWIIKVKPSNLDTELKNLAHGADAVQKFINDQLAKAGKSG